MNRLGLRAVSVLTCLAGLGLSDTALAQGPIITVTPNPVVFAAVAGGAISQPQTVKVTVNNPPASVQIVVNAPWIQVSQTSFNVGVDGTDIQVRINATNLTPGTYQGTFTVAAPGTANSFTVNVQATVQGASVLSANPASLSFSAQAGTTQSTPASTTVQVSSSGGALNYTLQTNVSWIGLSTGTGTTGGPGFTVSANPSGLTPGVYNGSIVVDSATTDDAVQIAVTLTVNANATLSFSPGVIAPFLFRIGGAVPTPKFLTVTSSGGQVAFDVAQSPTTNWLVVTPLSGAAGTNPATITLSVNPAGLSPGAYTTSLILTPVGGQPLVPIQIRLVVSNNPILQLSQTSLQFSSAFGSPGPPSRTVQATAVGGNIGYTVSSNQTWLTVTPNGGTTDSAVTVAVNPSNLPVGSYSGLLTFTPTNGYAYTITVPVTYDVIAVVQLTAGPGTLLFTHTPGQLAPQAQPIRVESVGQPVNFTTAATMSSCGQNWLSATANQETPPAVVTVAVNVTGQQAGICTGAVQLRYQGSGGEQSLTVPVTLAIRETPALRVSVPQGFGVITVQEGQQPQQQSISLTSTDPTVPVNFNITATSTGGPWLPSPGAGTTPLSVPIAFATQALAPGMYTGAVNIESASLPNTTFSIPVSLRVLPNITVSVSPNNLVFSHPQGGPVPASQNITITSSGEGATFTAAITQINGDWLQLSRTSGSASGTVAFSIKPNSLPQNSYMARIRFAFQNANIAFTDIIVILNVGPPRSIAVSTATLTFNHTTGNAAPAAQTFEVTGTGEPSSFSVGVTSSGWLSATPSTGSTPRTVTVSANPQGLAAGTYTGTVTITADGVSGSPRTVTVTLNVTAPPAPQPTTVTNSASGQAGPVAPGELITIKGAALGPASPQQFGVTAQGTVATTLGSVRVLFDGIPGTPLYVSEGQINVIAPYEIAGRLSVNVVVEYLGVRAQGILVQVANVAPGIYTLNAQGFGQAAALNQNGTINGPNARAPIGQAIVIYATGGGQTNPPSISHTVTVAPPLRNIVATARIGGLPATVAFAGAAPGLVTGVIQLNLVPHPDVHGPDLAVEFTVNGVTSTGGPTVAVQ